MQYTCNELTSQFEANLLYIGNPDFYQTALDADADGLACEHLERIYSRGPATRTSSGGGITKSIKRQKVAIIYWY